MHWYTCVAYFLGGAFLVNAVPHFVNGVSVRSFPTPFDHDTTGWRIQVSDEDDVADTDPDEQQARELAASLVRMPSPT
jgi:hypothetical protein